MEPQDEHLAAGTLVAGRFRIEHRLGEGGMADVYAATDQATKEPIALKLLKPEIAANEEAVARFRREAEVLRNLNHRAVVRLETFGALPDGRIFIAMELLEGETLGELVRRKKVLTPHELAPVIAGACAGLAAAHKQGIVHRDLKPDNIFLAKEGDEFQVKLLDFGISKVYGSDKLTQTGEVLGTPRYMAPEQLAAERDLDGRTDVYALGVMAYEALAGTPPFAGATATDLILSIIHGKYAPLRSYVKDISPELEGVVARAMAKSREARFREAPKFASAYLDALAPAAAPDGARPRNSLTEAMGSVDPNPVPAPRKQRLPAGTFSELPEHKPDISTPEVAAAAPPSGGSATAKLPSPLGKGAPVPENAAPSRENAVPSPESEAIGSRWSEGPEQSAYVEPTGTGGYALPVKKSRWPLFIIALLAGGLSAGIAIAILSHLGEDDATAIPSVEGDEVGVAAGTPAGTPDPSAEHEHSGEPEDEVDHASAEPAEPLGAAPPAPNSTRAALRGVNERTPATMRSTAPPAQTAPQMVENTPAPEPTMVAPPPAPPDPVAPPPAAPEPPTPVASARELFTQARDAFRAGRAPDCVRLAGQSVGAGGGPDALRLQGDCLVATGQRAEALRSYEQFCRVGPTHPRIAAVRQTVLSMGGQCP